MSHERTRFGPASLDARKIGSRGHLEAVVVAAGAKHARHLGVVRGCDRFPGLGIHGGLLLRLPEDLRPCMLRQVLFLYISRYVGKIPTTTICLLRQPTMLAQQPKCLAYTASASAQSHGFRCWADTCCWDLKARLRVGFARIKRFNSCTVLAEALPTEQRTISHAPSCQMIKTNSAGEPRIYEGDTPLRNPPPAAVAASPRRHAQSSTGAAPPPPPASSSPVNGSQQRSAIATLSHAVMAQRRTLTPSISQMQHRVQRRASRVTNPQHVAAERAHSW